MAVREGFEPSIRCRIHTFQACSFSHSDTSPFFELLFKARVLHLFPVLCLVAASHALRAICIVCFADLAATRTPHRFLNSCLRREFFTFKFLFPFKAWDLALAYNSSTGLPVQVAAACNLGERWVWVNDFSVKNSVNHCGCCLFSQIAEKIAFWADGGEKKAEAVCLLSRGLLV